MLFQRLSGEREGARYRGVTIPDGPMMGQQLGHLARGGCTLAPDAYLFKVIDRAILAARRERPALRLAGIGFGRERVFRDVHSISVDKIEEALPRSAVVVAVVGPRWANADNLPRLED